MGKADRAAFRILCWAMNMLKLNKIIIIVSLTIASFLLPAMDYYGQATEPPESGSEQSSSGFSPGENGLNLPPGLPCGSFSNRVTRAVLQNPQVAGTMISASWKTIERSRTTFDWAAVDSALRQAQKAHLPVTLNLIAGGASTPDWVKKMPGVQRIYLVDTNEYRDRYCTKVSIPVFWDELYLQEKERFIAEAGNRYGSNPNIVGVMVSFANAFTNDWCVPHAVGRFCGRAMDQVKTWINKGYTTDKMLNAGKRTIDAWARAFPAKALKLPIQVTHERLDGTASNLAEMIADYGFSNYPERFYIQVNSLNALTPNSSDVVDANPNTYGYILQLLTQHPNRIGLQMLASASNGNVDNCRQNGGVSPCPAHDVLMNSVVKGLSYNPNYIEYWYQDVQNTDLQDVLEYANNGMASCSEAPR
jgi:hypothetical protein